MKQIENLNGTMTKKTEDKSSATSPGDEFSQSLFTSPNDSTADDDDA